MYPSFSRPMMMSIADENVPSAKTKHKVHSKYSRDQQDNKWTQFTEMNAKSNILSTISTAAVARTSSTNHISNINSSCNHKLWPSTITFKLDLKVSGKITVPNIEETKVISFKSARLDTQTRPHIPDQLCNWNWTTKIVSYVMYQSLYTGYWYVGCYI